MAPSDHQATQKLRDIGVDRSREFISNRLGVPIPMDAEWVVPGSFKAIMKDEVFHKLLLKAKLDIANEKISSLENRILHLKRKRSLPSKLEMNTSPTPTSPTKLAMSSAPQSPSPNPHRHNIQRPTTAPSNTPSNSGLLDKRPELENILRIAERNHFKITGGEGLRPSKRARRE